MSNIFSIIKDIIIAAVIAVLTSGLFEVSNIIYQSVITVLILVIIFLILRRIDKKAKRLEILSILYVEQFLIPFMKSLKSGQNTSINGTNIKKIKVFIILPKSIAELVDIQPKVMRQERFEIRMSEIGSRGYTVSGKRISDDQLILFDTPASWAASLHYLQNVKGMNARKISQLLKKMTDDIETYTIKISKNDNIFENLKFISLSEFEDFYN